MGDRGLRSAVRIEEGERKPPMEPGNERGRTLAGPRPRIRSVAVIRSRRDDPGVSDSARVLELALEVGFDLAGIAPLRAPRHATQFEVWLDQGRHGQMAWFERHRARVLDPTLIAPQAHSLLVVGSAHSRPAVELPDGGRVARYAAGRDYHNVMTRRLRKLARRLEAEGLSGARRSIVDAGPLLERSHAEEAGLGFLSKAANLLHPEFGPWFFLGELLVTKELEPTEAGPFGSCGTCTACLEVCPTDAIVAPGEVDARRCLSYLTIEVRGPIAREFRTSLGEWAFGCDLCSEVCPWGRDAPDRSDSWGSHRALQAPLVSWLLEGEAREERLQGSPLRRAKREGLARNAALVLGNRPSEEGRGALLQALERDPSATVREAAGWALAHAHAADGGVRDALQRAHAREPEVGARSGLKASLEEADSGSGPGSSPSG